MSAMCGRLRVGKENLHVAGLVGAAMCSACLCGSQPQNHHDAAVKRVGEAGVDAACAVLDVTDPTAVTKAADAIVTEQGKDDILVNSA